MKIYYPARSRFLEDCEEGIRRNKNSLMNGVPFSINFSHKGYNGTIQVCIEKTNPKSFQTNWEGYDVTRFPVRIKAAAYALFRQDCFGDFVISHKTGTLIIQCLSSSSEVTNVPIVPSKPSIKTEPNPKPIRKNVESSTRKKQLVEILTQIPLKAWESIVSDEPEWKEMGSFLDVFGYGPFAVLMITTGLNDYQLKGKAEVAYWPKIRKLLDGNPVPHSSNELYVLLEQFYQQERLTSQKIRRLRTLLTSPLSEQLWRSSPKEVAKNFLAIWQQLAQTMEQKPQDKTISFAMKCLGISQLMAKEYEFDFTSIPIPVDLRVVRFTKKTGIIDSENSHDIRNLWNDVLFQIKEHNLNVTMVHLDSLIWQIASLKESELFTYFENKGLQEVGGKILNFLQYPLSDNQSTNPLPNDKKILILFPCSGKKKPDRLLSNEIFSSNEEKKVIDFIEKTREHLLKGREKISDCLEKDTKAFSALDRYNGSLYRVNNFRKSLKQAYAKRNIYVLILSGAYGLLTPNERIHYYNKKMDANYWIGQGLPNIIEEFIKKNKITHVYGFFSRTTDYIKIMKTLDWQELKQTTNLETAKTYYVDFQGSGAEAIVPGITGSLIVSFINSNFSQDNFYENPFHGQDVSFISHL